MQITSIVENTSAVGMPVEHGLSLYIKLDDGQNVLFDMGQRRLFAENAERLGLDISDIDIAIISHGHYDHGGGLHTFLNMNDKAKIFIHRDAFQPHFSLRETGLKYIGLDVDIQNNNRIIFCNDSTSINGHMTLFAGVKGTVCCPCGNRLLFEAPSGSLERGELEMTKINGLSNDAFTHEQNLIIEEGNNVILFAGCAHNGIINIMQKAESVLGKTPTHVLAGMHLVKSGLSAEDESNFISNLAHELMLYKGCKFYTMHCTGTEQYAKLKAMMGDQIEYLSCGESIKI